MTGTPHDPFSFDDWLAWLEDPSKHLGAADRGFVAALVRQRFAALLGRVDALEGDLTRVRGMLSDAMAFVPSAVAMDYPLWLAEVQSAALRAGSLRGEESDTASAACAAPSSPDGAPAEETRP